MIGKSKVLWYLGAGAVSAAVGLVLRSALRRPKVGPGSDSLSEKLRLAALGLLPDRDTVLEPPNPVWDQVLGGKRPPSFDAPSWGYFSVFVGKKDDGTKVKGGTSCAIFAACCASLAGWPADMINRSPNDAMAPGASFVPGAHILRLLEGAKRRGWLQKGAQPMAGDLYCTTRAGAVYDGKPSSGEHVGIVIDVSAPAADGSRKIITADAGDSNARGEQCAKWHTRTYYPDGRLSLYPGDNAKIAWIIRPE